MSAQVDDSARNAEATNHQGAWWSTRRCPSGDGETTMAAQRSLLGRVGVRGESSPCRWRRALAIALAVVCALSFSPGTARTAGPAPSVSTPRSAAPQPIVLTPQILRAALILREFRLRALALGPVARDRVTVPTTITGADLEAIVTRVAATYVSLEAGGHTDTTDQHARADLGRLGRLASSEIARLVATPAPAVTGVDLDGLVKRVIDRYHQLAAREQGRGHGPTAAHALAAASAPPEGLNADVALTEAALAAAATEAKADWARANPGVDLGGLSFDVGNLPGLQLGNTEGKRITIDATAAGFGWDAMYPGAQSSRMDLLTAVRHEIGFGRPDHRRARPPRRPRPCLGHRPL